MCVCLCVYVGVCVWVCVHVHVRVRLIELGIESCAAVWNLGHFFHSALLKITQLYE